MAERKHDKYIITKAKSDLTLPDFRRKLVDDAQGSITPLIYLDSDILKGAFYVECAWFLKGRDEADNEAHTHPFDEVITFFGTNFEDPHDLCGEIELWLEGEKFVMTKSFLAYIPAGMKHCPLKILRIDRPIFHFTLGPGKMYG